MFLFHNRLQHIQHIYKKLDFRLICTRKHLLTHYEVLNLPKNCSTKEVKDSFIKLSKKHHPDISKGKDAHKKFLEITEAYKVLSNKELRRHYDLGLIPMNEVYGGRGAHMYYKGQFSSEDHSRDKQRFYYGIKGTKKLSNLTLAMICMAIVAFGVGLQIIAIRHALNFHRGELARKSNDAAEQLKKARKAASANGNELQLELLRQRFEEEGNKRSGKIQ